FSSAGLKVVFSVTSAYSEDAKLCKTDALRLSLPAFQAATSSCLPPEKEATPTETEGDNTLTATSAAQDTSSLTLRRASEGHRRPDCQPPLPVRMAAAAPTGPGPCVHAPPSNADSGSQLSSTTPTALETDPAVASSRSLA
ncbi:unnamed protein product, partial [Laminaria digitata]